VLVAKGNSWITRNRALKKSEVVFLFDYDAKRIVLFLMQSISGKYYPEAMASLRGAQRISIKASVC